MTDREIFEMWYTKRVDMFGDIPIETLTEQDRKRLMDSMSYSGFALSVRAGELLEALGCEIDKIKTGFKKVFKL